jgi:hypothetical protein
MAQTKAIRGKHVTLQSVEIKDTKVVFDIRSYDNNLVYLHKSSEEEHNSWITNQINRVQDFYFCIVNNNSKKVVGTIGVYNFSFGKAEWGRWVVNNDPLAAVESVILLMDFAFNLKLEEMYCRVDIENTHTIRFHNSLNYSSIVKNPQEIIYILNETDWPNFENAYRNRFRLGNDLYR